LMGVCFLTLFRIRRTAQRTPTLNWLVDYTLMVEIAILGFLTSGAFLGFVYLDLIYQMIGMTVVLKMLLRKELQELSANPVAQQGLMEHLDTMAVTV
jgi:hypothetical protein